MSKSRQLSDAINSVDISESAPADAVTLDASGNLLVGKTASDVSTEGVELRPDLLVAVRDNGNPAYFRRNSSDGEIVNFIKDGTKVGSIGTTGGRIGIGTGDCGVYYNETLDAIIPANPSTTFTNRDAAIDFGVSGVRFKDLYLSGGVYLGGTGSANYLDDYEEGTWTPVFAGITDAGTITFTNNGCKYTKVGNLVHVSFAVSFSGISGATGAYLSIKGLPFTKQSSHNPSGTGFFSNLDLDSDTKMVTWAFNSTGGDGLTTLLYESKDNTSTGLVTPSQYSSSTALNFSMTYLAQ